MAEVTVTEVSRRSKSKQVGALFGTDLGHLVVSTRFGAPNIFSTVRVHCRTATIVRMMQVWGGGKFGWVRGNFAQQN